MNITILTVGSRGDTQPYIALALGLKQRGHTVKLVVPKVVIDLPQEAGIDYISLSIDIKQALERRSRLMKQRMPLVARLRSARNLVKNFVPPLLDESIEACRGSDLILFGGITFAYSSQVVEVLKIPGLHVFLQPFTPTGKVASYIVSCSSIGPFNRLSHRLMSELIWRGYKPGINAWREGRGLPVIKKRNPLTELTDGPVLYGYSPQVFPPPGDWPARHFPAGYWFWDREEEYTPPPGLVEFLQAGPAPVYIGFGSMAALLGENTAALVKEAVEQSGCRAVFVTGWGQQVTTELSSRIYALEAVPHDWLFPQVAAVIHHGGAGTTAAGLRAGKPTQIVAHISDQKFWSFRVRDLGAGLVYIHRKKLTVKKLARAITTLLTNQSLAENAARVGEKLRGEDGVGRAVAFIETYMAR